MSQPHFKEFSRSRPSLRTLSGSEEEDSVFTERSVKVRATRSSRSFSSSQHYPNKNVHSQQTSSSHYTSQSNNNSAQSVSNHKSQTPTVTPLDRVRWFIWKWAYLLIITCINFDVWLLWRLNSFGKYKVVSLFLLLPFILYFLCSMSNEEDGFIKNSIILLQYIFDSMQSLTYSIFTFISQLSLEDTWSGTCLNLPFILPSFSIFSNFYSNEKSPPVKVTTDSNQPSVSVTKETSFYNEILIKKVSDLENQIKVLLEHNKKSETENSIRNELGDMRLQISSLESSLNMMPSSTVKDTKPVFLDDDKNKVLDSINARLANMEQELSSLKNEKKCCSDKLNTADAPALFEQYFVAALKNVMNSNSNPQSSFHAFKAALDARYVSQNKLQKELNSLLEKIQIEMETKQHLFDEKNFNLQKIMQDHMNTLKDYSFSGVSNVGTETVSLENINKIIKEALMLYDADKTGKVDYALESGGGSVLGTRCSESYLDKNGRLSLFGFPFWSDHNSPRTAIQPDVQPGKCWAFKGNQGFLVIQLSYLIYLTGFSLEHIPASLSPTGTIDSAPKDFSVWGLISESDTVGKFIEEYSYDKDGEPLQYFPIKNTSLPAFSYIELKIHSNHGNLEYTCLYRFRVHGKRVP